MGKPRIWFITGSSSGLGLDLVNHILANKDIVVATLRSPATSPLPDIAAKHSPDQILVIPCDVTDLSSISSAFDLAISKFGRIDIVVNNAAHGIICEIEGTDLNDARKLFDVNFWGAVNVAREAIRVFREKNGRDVNGKYIGGWLMNQTSMTGLSGMSCIGFYSASKHALEGFTDAFSQELDPQWNIRISLLELGFFRTKMVKNAVKTQVHPLYTSPSLSTYQVREFLEGDGKNIQGNPYLAAERTYRLGMLYDTETYEKKQLPDRFILGDDALALVGQKVKAMKDDMERFRTWSEGLNVWE